MDNPVLVQLTPTIFSFLTFEELNRCSESCKDWKAFTSSAHARNLWYEFHKRIWAEATFNVPRFDLSDREYTLIDRIALVPGSDLVNYLGLKRSEADLKVAVAKLLFPKEVKMRKFTHNNEVIPDWLYNLDRYKASYIQSRLEIRRSIFASDLVANSWSFTYSLHGVLQHLTVTFFADGTLLYNTSGNVHQYRVCQAFE